MYVCLWLNKDQWFIHLPLWSVNSHHTPNVDVAKQGTRWETRKDGVIIMCSFWFAVSRQHVYNLHIFVYICSPFENTQEILGGGGQQEMMESRHKCKERWSNKGINRDDAGNAGWRNKGREYGCMVCFVSKEPSYSLHPLGSFLPSFLPVCLLPHSSTTQTPLTCFDLPPTVCACSQSALCKQIKMPPKFSLRSCYPSVAVS